MSKVLTPYIKSQLANMIMGAKLGKGAYRTVFVNRISGIGPGKKNMPNYGDKKTVIKLEGTGGNFANIIEWELWNHVADGPTAKWFAPCYQISPSGGALIQARTYPITDAQLPKRVPGFFSDLKKDNWGLFEGRVVCHDYGNILWEKGSKLKVAKWRTD